MKNIFTLLLLLNVATYSSFTQSVVPEWTRYQENTDYGSQDYPFSVTDPNGNVIICGSSYHPGPVIGMVTTKYNAEGVWMWEARHDTYAQDFVASAVTDDDGNVYVAVNSINPVTNLLQFVVFKYDGNTGSVIWEYRYASGAANETSSVAKLLMLPGQRLIVVCRIYSPQIGGTQATVIALDTDANPVWEYQRGVEGSTSSAFGAVVDKNGDMVIWGWGSSAIVGESGLLCIRLHPDGTPFSDHVTLPYPDDFGKNYHIDLYGNLYLGDFVGEYKVTKYNIQGIQEWQYAKPFVPSPVPSFANARVYAICSDASGNVYAGGEYYMDSISGKNMYVTMLSSSGIPVWEHLLIVKDTNTSATVYDAVYIPSGIIAFGGSIQTDVPNNHLQPFIAYYTASGYLSGGICAMETPYNFLYSINADSSNVYISGLSYTAVTMPYIKRQFVSKIAAPQVSGTSALPRVQEMRAWPNPTSGSLQLSFYTTGTAGGTSAWAEIISTDGSVTLAESIPVQAGDNTCTLRSMERLPAGAYTVRVYVGREIFQGKVVRTEQK